MNSDRSSPHDIDDLVNIVHRQLDDDKAEDIITISLIGKSSIADYMVIASGRSQRQVSAMAVHLLEKLKASGVVPIGTEGLNSGDWVLVDAGDIIIHLFRPEVRAFYNLEKMWLMETPASVPNAPSAQPLKESSAGRERDRTLSTGEAAGRMGRPDRLPALEGADLSFSAG